MTPAIILDFWTVLSLAVSFLGIVISIYLFIKKSNSKTPYILLGLFTTILSYQIFESALFWSKLINILPYFYNISASLDLLTSPILYLFYKTLFDFRDLRKSSLFHFLPFAIVATSLVPYYLLDTESKRIFLSGQTGYKYYFTSLPILISIQMLTYLVVTFRTIKSQNNIGSVKALSSIHLALFALIFVSNTIYYYITFFTTLSNPFIDYNATILLSIVVLLSGWFGIISPAVLNGSSIKDALISKQTYTMSYDFKYDFLKTHNVNSKTIKPFSNNYNANHNIAINMENEMRSNFPSNVVETVIKTENIKYKNSGLTTSAANELKDLLDNFMINTKTYRENTIGLDSLSAKLNTTRHNLSQVINEKYKLNFFDYINMLRINEAKELLENKKNRKMQIIEVAYSVGYNNKVTFNNAFKKFTGLTPSQYRLQKLKDEITIL